MAYFQISDHVEWRAADNEVVVLDLRTELYLTFNDTGAFLWEAIAGGTPNEELAGKLVESFAVDEVVAARGASAFVAELVERGLVRNGEAALDQPR